MYNKTLRLLNNLDLNGKELIVKLIDFKNNIEKLINTEEEYFSLNKKKCFIHLHKYEKQKNINYTHYNNFDLSKIESIYVISISCEFNKIYKDEVQNIVDLFLQSINSKYHINNLDKNNNYIPRIYYISNQSYNKNNLTLRFEGPLDYINLIKLSSNFEELNKKNLLEALELYTYLFKLKDMSEIKSFKTLFFGNVQAKKIDPIFDELANERKIIIEKSSSGSIKNIIMNKNKDNETELFKFINKLKQNGIIKNLDGNQYFEYHNKINFEIYNYKPFKGFYINFIYENDNLSLLLLSNHFKDSINILKDLEIYEQSIEKIKNKFKDKICFEIEQLLNLEILNKNEFNYNEDNCSFDLNNMQLKFINN